MTRPLGGWILHARPERMRAAVGASLLAGAAGTLLLAAREAARARRAVGAALVGLAAGIPFAPAFTGAALPRPDAPAAAVGLVNGAASVVALVGTPLLGLSFALPGGGRTGFVVVAGAVARRLPAAPERRAGWASPTAATRSPSA